MDKRSILFIVCVSAAFFVANLYFVNQQQEQEKEWHAYQKVKQEKIEREKKDEISKRTKSLDQLPLVEIYADNAASHKLSVGVIEKGSILALGWNEMLPKVIWARPYGVSGALTSYELDANEAMENLSLKGKPVVYSIDGAGKVFISDVPLFGNYDVQMVTPTDGTAEVSLGEIVDGAFESFRTQTEMNSPPAFALIEQDKNFLPVGIISGANEKLTDLEEFESVRGFVEKSPQEKSAPTATAKEKLYVLQNAFQQLVFSNVGGSLVEINLPFETKGCPCVVKEVEADREMIQYDPKNAQFPLAPYMLPSATEPKAGVEGGYYPLLRRNFVEPGTLKERKVEPQFYALNIISEYPELAQLVFEVKEFTSEKIVFEAKQRNRTITKTFTLPPTQEAAPYVFNLDIKVDGDTRGLWITTGLLEAEWVAGAIAPTLKYRITKKGEPVVEQIDLPADSSITTSVTPDWIANSNGFFGLILDPQGEMSPGWRTQKVPGTTVYSRLVALEQEHTEWNPQDLPSYMMMLPLPQKGKSSFRVFAGPFDKNILNKVDNIYRDPKTKASPDYIASQTFHGWFAFISEPFAKFLFWIMEFFYWITHSWGLSIILVTVVLRILLFPLNAWSTKSMIGMQKISPKVQALQEKYKNDKQKLQMEIMDLYRKEKVNPFSGCLPLLIQMPFLIGMFDLLKSAFPLRGACFIPGWIDDLSAPDVLFSWNYSIPFIGSEFHLLPIILGVVMFFQSRMGPKIDPSKMSEQQRQQRASGTIMAVLFTVLFYRFPSGLNIYWLSSMLLGILQQWWTQKKMNGNASVGSVSKPN